MLTVYCLPKDRIARVFQRKIRQFSIDPICGTTTVHCQQPKHTHDCLWYCMFAKVKQYKEGIVISTIYLLYEFQVSEYITCMNNDLPAFSSLMDSCSSASEASILEFLSYFGILGWLHVLLFSGTDEQVNGSLDRSD